MDEKLKQQIIDLLKESLSIQLEFSNSECMGKELKVIISMAGEEIAWHKESID